MKKMLVIGLIAGAISFPFFGCSPSQAQLDAQATQIAENIFETQTAAPTATATITPTATFTPTTTCTPTATFSPTPIPGKFISPPEYLETVFFSDWIWSYNAAKQRIGSRIDWTNAIIYIMHYETNYAIYLTTVIPQNTEDEFSDDFIASVLQYYVSGSTQEKIIAFKNTNTEIGKYETTIDEFNIRYQISLDKGNVIKNISLAQN